ncbi:MAG: glycoside hydrolase family 140 protein [Clostridia bacterium]|nr:glycoside hydrolase family 140 protein [Clostridia bacterium]
MKLTLSSNRRHFLMDGKPFFWLGDTAWLLFQKLSFEEALVYLDNRAAKGFTVIQATLVHTAQYTNPAGSPALLEDDFARPNPDSDESSYWPQVRRIVDAAAARGMMMALLPSWGCFVKNGQLHGEKIDRYTDFLAATFGGCENVLWLVGGDVRGSAAPEEFHRLGCCLRQKCPQHLIGYHPFGRCSSSMWFHDASWLDFNMFQSGHRRYDQVKLNTWDDRIAAETCYGEDNYRYVQHDYALSPTKPVLDGEPSYERIPQGLHDPSQPYWQDSDIRRYAYWSLLAGACGFTYGSNAIMQFWRGVEEGSYGVRETWQDALHNPGSMQMTHVRSLMEAIAWQDGVPAQDCLVDNSGEKYDYNLALLTPRALCIYTHTGKPFAVNTTLLPAPLYGWWFDPVSGGRSCFGPVHCEARVLFTPPDRHSAPNDWVLLLTPEASL